MKKMHVYEVIMDTAENGLQKKYMLASSVKDLKSRFANPEEIVKIENVSDDYKFDAEKYGKLRDDLSKAGWSDVYIDLIIGSVMIMCPNID